MLNKIKAWITQRVLSRTYRFAAIMSAVMALEANFALLQPYLPGNVYAYISVAMAVGMAYYREVTSTPLSSK